MSINTASSSGLSGDDEMLRLKAELDALQYENEKLKKVNDVLMQRVEMGWGNNSTAYSSFQNAALLAEQVKNKTLKLRQTQNRLEAANLDLSRSRQESALSRQRLYDLVESISDAIVLFDKERKLILANSHFYEFWKNTGANIEIGKTRLDDLTQMSIKYGVFDPAYSPPETNLRRNDPIKDSVFRLTNGRWLQMSERSTTDDGLVVVYTDITQIKEYEIVRQERILAEKNRVVQSTLDNLPQGVSLVNAAGELEFWNHRFLEQLGLCASSVQAGMDYLSVLSETEVYQEALAFSRLCDTENSSSQGFEKEKQLSNGVVLDIRSHLLTEGGSVNTYTDITERSRSAEALRESEHRIRLITDAMPALISYINSDSCYEFANKAFEEWFDQSSKEIEGKYLRQVLGDREYDNHKSFVVKALQGETVNFELEQLLPNQRRRISNKTYIPHYDAHHHVVGFFALEQDVTEHRRTAQALRHAYQHMEQRVFERTKELNDLNKQLQSEIYERAQIEQDLLAATRNAEEASASKVKFMAAAGHDLLQPMNAARLFSAALLDSDLDDDLYRLANSLNRSLDDVESIITTLVDISKLEADVVEPVPEAFVVDDLLCKLADEFSVQAQNLSLSFAYIPSRAVVNTDSQLLARILRNLLTNAIRYTDEGKILLGCRRRHSGLEIQVIDTGIGIAADQLEQVFQEFQRVHARRPRDDKGLGLGLAIVEKLARVLHCDVSVRSVPGRGSVFSVRVPFGELEAKRQSSGDVSAALESPLQNKRILVIDNDEAICEGMDILLSSWDCDVVTVTTLEELAEWHRTLVPSPDLIVVDYHLDNGATGFDAIDLIRQEGAISPVVMVTANHTKELRQHASSLGYGLLNKPVKPLKLRALITRLLGGA